jgi:hypothetical protein
MFDLNPLADPDALWQHLVMITGAIILGYMIGHVTEKPTILYLENELAELEIQHKVLKRNRTL